MRALIVVVVIVVAGCASALEGLTPQAAGAFRRCWPSIEPSYCAQRFDWGIGESARCRSEAEGSYARTQKRGRWLVRWGCPASVLQGENPR